MHSSVIVVKGFLLLPHYRKHHPRKRKPPITIRNLQLPLPLLRLIPCQHPPLLCRRKELVHVHDPGDEPKHLPTSICRPRFTLMYHGSASG